MLRKIYILTIIMLFFASCSKVDEATLTPDQEDEYIYLRADVGSGLATRTTAADPEEKEIKSVAFFIMGDNSLMSKFLSSDPVGSEYGFDSPMDSSTSGKYGINLKLKSANAGFNCEIVVIANYKENGLESALKAITQWSELLAVKSIPMTNDSEGITAPLLMYHQSANVDLFAENLTLTINLRRIISRIDVVNRAITEGYTISSVRLLNPKAQTYLLPNHSEDEISSIPQLENFSPAKHSVQGEEILKLYTYEMAGSESQQPLSVEVIGSFNGVDQIRTVAFKDNGKPGKITRNSYYCLYASVSSGKVIFTLSDPDEGKFITGFSIAPSLILYDSKQVTITGKGFKVGDIIVFHSLANEYQVTLNASDINGNMVEITLLDNVANGEYDMMITRDVVTQDLERKCRINAQLSMTVLDLPGMNVKGVVYCDGKPVKGVRMSDGIVTTTTNEDGHYWLNSDKKNGYVFMSFPSSYEPVGGSNVVSAFFSNLSSNLSQVDQCNFQLRKVDNDNHVLIAAADLHLANRGSVTNDLNQFKSGFIVDVKEVTASYSGMKVYSLILGDFTWDQYWYRNNFGIQQYVNLLNGSSYPNMMFHAVGNHDHDPYVANDNFRASRQYRSVLGPTYYSMNIGKVHYVVLDNSVYINNGASSGTMGDRSYQAYIPDEQINWLKEDLAALEDKSMPVVVALHCNAYNNFNNTFTNKAAFTNSSVNNPKLLNCFTGFSDVHFLSGHQHVNMTMAIAPNIIEHNIASVAGVNWWSGKLSGVNSCCDGSPGGFETFVVNGTNMKWYYQPSRAVWNAKQFRAYDMNTVKAHFDQPSVQNIVKQCANRGDGNDYKNVEANTVYINVWKYEKERWTIKVKDLETGQFLEVKRVYDRDPLHTLVMDIPRILAGEASNSNWESRLNSHMFSAKSTSATSTLEITVTDRFGNIFTETMTRPKAYSASMN